MTTAKLALMKSDRASDTAVLIARSLLLADATPALRPLLSDHSARLTRILLNETPGGRWFEFCLRHRPTRNLLFGFERLFLPGIFLHYHTRKLRLAEFVKDTFASGCRQLVVLGAGLDTLAWRHSLQTGTACFELDHPATQAIKRRAFQKEKRSPVLIAADLTRDLPSRLLRGDSKFDPSDPVVIIAEGLLMYFSPARVSQLLEDLANVAAPGSKIAFTFMEARPGQPLGFHNGRQAVNSWLKARGEPFQWGIPRDPVDEFATRHGWTLTSLSSPEEFRTRLLKPHGLENAPLALGESIAFAQKTSSSSVP